MNQAVSRISLLQNRHHGERAVVVANGPSLNRMDLGFLRKEIVIGLNKIYLGLNKFRFYPRYYVAINDKVVQQATDHIKQLTCVQFISKRNAALVPESALTYHINTNDPPERFCRDISRGVHEGWTVTYAALQIAYYLGFKEVVLIGLDHHYEYNGAPNDASRMNGDDPNHFSPDYFGGGQSWDNPDLQNSEESYRVARAVYEADGRRIIDATLGGACTIFQKSDYKEVFNQRL